MNIPGSFVISKRISAGFAILLAVILLTAGCALTSPRLSVAYDQVKGETRYKLEMNYWSNTFAPQFYLKQTLVKLTREGHPSSISVYDVITTSSSRFNLSPEVYLLVDNQSFRMSVKSVEFLSNRNISENTKDILTADSSTVKVVTGYTLSEQQITRYEYDLTPEVISAILRAKYLAFRYYAGPEMITMEADAAKMAAIRQLMRD